MYILNFNFNLARHLIALIATDRETFSNRNDRGIIKLSAFSSQLHQASKYLRTIAYVRRRSVESEKEIAQREPREKQREETILSEVKDDPGLGSRITMI